ncbi:hypothetical protein GGS20DRAFT_549726 [Poronia punctata]|nr:hypothetical protein GGS20DRAFT_549726 [Poronia punctata]
MATLDVLKDALRETATATALSSARKLPLSETQYSAGFETLMRSGGQLTYDSFVLPQLSAFLAPLFRSRAGVSILEIGPGPQSVLGSLPEEMRRKVRTYDAFETSTLHADRLQKWLCASDDSTGTGLPFPCLRHQPDIRRVPFPTTRGPDCLGNDHDEEKCKYDVVLFCHSLYGIETHRGAVDRALNLLVKKPADGLVLVFHRRDSLHLAGLAASVAAQHVGTVRIKNDDAILDLFACFIAGFTFAFAAMDQAVRERWKENCRVLGRREKDGQGEYIAFSAPEIAMAFTQHCTAVPKLERQVPVAVTQDFSVKNREARWYSPAAVARPWNIGHVQACIRWAIEHGVGLTVVGGGHGGQCLWPGVVAVDMTAFDQVHVVTAKYLGGEDKSDPLLVVGAGSKTGDVVREALNAGLTVPLGSRPSVGAGLWLQGGIGHLARLHGLSCDVVVGAVIIGLESGAIFYVGNVPSEYRPKGAVRPYHENDLLWAIRGGGTNFGIVVSVVFSAFPAKNYLVQNLVVPLRDGMEARLVEDRVGEVSRNLPRHCSADAYLYWDEGSLQLGLTVLEASESTFTVYPFENGWEKPAISRVVDGIGLFETEMYMSAMHGGHGGGKTSSFKRCIFIEDIDGPISAVLTEAVKSRPSPFCYLHLLHGGGAVGDMAPEATAFGCRDWSYACVITGVWDRDRDATEDAQAVVRWVYTMAHKLLSLGCGAYGADLGPDPRDIPLAARAFGPNSARLARLKQGLDPHHVLKYACPMPSRSKPPSLVILVTGESCAGKDFCAEVWASVLSRTQMSTSTGGKILVHVASISEVTKREYAAASGADANRLLRDRAYKERHRQAMTAFFRDQVRRNPRLPEEHFLSLVHIAGDVDVLLITGLREESPVAILSHLVPESKLVEVGVRASEESRWDRLNGRYNSDIEEEEDEGGINGPDVDNNVNNNVDSDVFSDAVLPVNSRPTLVFNNDVTGRIPAEQFALDHLCHFLHPHLRALENTVRPVPDFPRQSIEFRHVLGVAEHRDGLLLSTELIRDRYTHVSVNMKVTPGSGSNDENFGKWGKVGAIVCCEAGGFIFASALAFSVNVPLALVRTAGKLPPPTVSVAKSSSHISSSSSSPTSTPSPSSEAERIEIGRDAVPHDCPIVVVDDVLATGETLCGVLDLLIKAGANLDYVTVLVVAEFPLHRGRDLLRRRGFGQVNIESLLVFGGP